MSKAQKRATQALQRMKREYELREVPRYWAQHPPYIRWDKDGQPASNPKRRVLDE